MVTRVDRSHFAGIIPPLVTPFTADGDIEEKAFRSEIEYMSQFPLRGIAVGGSTGEGASLSPDETASLVRLAREDVSDDRIVIAGVITTSTRDAVDRGRRAAEAGADALLVTPPIYNTASADALVDFYAEIWESVRLPIVLYNVVRSTPLTPAITARLTEVPGVMATKESSAGTLETLDQIVRDLGDKIAVTWAQDELMVPGYLLGAVGSISAINAVLPGHSCRALAAVRAGNLGEAMHLHRQMADVGYSFVGADKPALVKAAISAQGRQAGVARRPFLPPSPDVEAAIERAVRRAGVAAS
jgi:dihydrodipicolinate synthase/N-acetylneuraminate lyase